MKIKIGIITFVMLLTVFLTAFKIVNPGCVADIKAGNVTVTDLRCEYRNNPLGIENASPRLSWKIKDSGNTRRQKQTSYQVLVASSESKLSLNIGDLWNSKEITSDQSQQVLYDGATLIARQQCYWKVRIKDKAGHWTSWSPGARFSIGKLGETWGTWICKKGRSMLDHNWYRKNFTLLHTPKQAMFHIASGGYFELYVNGKKAEPDAFRFCAEQNGKYDFGTEVVDIAYGADGIYRYLYNQTGVVTFNDATFGGDPAHDKVKAGYVRQKNFFLNPVLSHMGAMKGLEDETTRALYLTYDITDLLHKGDNVIAIWHGSGWTSWYLDRTSPIKTMPFALNIEGNIDYKGGSIIILSDTSWKVKTSSSAYTGDWEGYNFGGEVIDARKHIPDWNAEAFNDSDWDNAVVWNGSVPDKLSPQILEPQIRYKTITPIAITGEGPYLVDMGQNYTGFFEINLLNGISGQTVTFDIADKTTEITTMSQRSKYIYDSSGKGTFSNRFNYGAGRWITISGLNYKPSLNDIKGYVITSNRKQISSFNCSNDLLNKIYKTNIATYLANTLDGILMDCPHRERRGWGEVSVAALYGDAMPNFESGAYMDQYLQYLRDFQDPNGQFYSIINDRNAPHRFLMWCVNNPISVWENYRWYGDKKALADNYLSMTRWFDWLHKVGTDKSSGIVPLIDENFKSDKWHVMWPGLGDWATPHGNFVESVNSKDAFHFNNCIYAYILERARRIAAETGNLDDESTYAVRRDLQRSYIHSHNFNSKTKTYNRGIQVDQLFALIAGVPPVNEKESVENVLEYEMLYGFPYYDTGSSGQGLYTRYLLEDRERMDLVYELLTDKGHPGYGYFLEQGLTTWPEVWSGKNESMIHTCYTGIGGYFILGFGGIRPDPDSPGMKKFIIKPAVVGDLEWADVSHQSIYGDIVCNWKVNKSKGTFDIEIPPNTEATVYIPANNANSVSEGGYAPAHTAPGIRYIGMEEHKAYGNLLIYNVKSGVYKFSVDNIPPRLTFPEPLYNSNNLALNARANASSFRYIHNPDNPNTEAFKANDGNIETAWTANGVENEWLELNWKTPQTINKVVIKEAKDIITNFKIQHYDGNRWVDDYTSKTTDKSMEQDKVITFPLVATSKMRILIISGSDRPVISEFEIYYVSIL